MYRTGFDLNASDWEPGTIRDTGASSVCQRSMVPIGYPRYRESSRSLTCGRFHTYARWISGNCSSCFLTMSTRSPTSIMVVWTLPKCFCLPRTPSNSTTKLPRFENSMDLFGRRVNHHDCQIGPVVTRVGCGQSSTPTGSGMTPSSSAPAKARRPASSGVPPMICCLIEFITSGLCLRYVFAFSRP
jgi:hypothetical protein